MNKKSLYLALTGAVVAAGLTCCSSDYLDTAPITSISDQTAVATTEAAQMSIYGISRIMNTQLSMGRSHNGENSSAVWIGEALGPDNNSFFYMREMGQSWYTWQSMGLPTSSLCRNFWDYAYMLVGRANTILATIDDATGPEDEKQWIKAQAYTFRAHGYIRAMQWFGPRWQDSNNGSAYGVVLRTEPGTEPAALGTCNEIMDLIYSDLTAAIDLYQASKKSRKYTYEPDIDIAYGLFARAAMWKQDWATAKTMAHNARQNYPVMTNEDWLSGFIWEADDYMWTNPDNDIYWSSFGAWFSCNGAYPSSWGYGLNMDMSLYRLIDDNDIRKQVFFGPDKIAQLATIPGYEEVAEFTEADFWNPEMIVAGTMDFANGPMAKLADAFVTHLMNTNPYSGYVTNKPFCKVAAGVASQTPDVLSLGAAGKMWCMGVNGVYGDSYFPWMRATEFLLTEAEAAYMSGDMSTAANLITELNSMRIPGYTAPAGDALLDDIRLSRRIELWGEGHAWYDFKRWNLPIENKVWKAGDVESGNTPDNYKGNHAVGDANGWRLMIPMAETDFNPAFDRTLLNY